MNDERVKRRLGKDVVCLIKGYQFGGAAMIGQMSRAQRREACVQVAEEMIDRPEVWYDAHRDGSFGEVEQQARQERRKFMGQVLEILVNGRDTEFRLQGSAASAVGAR